MATTARFTIFSNDLSERRPESKWQEASSRVTSRMAPVVPIGAHLTSADFPCQRLHLADWSCETARSSRKTTSGPFQTIEVVAQASKLIWFKPLVLGEGPRRREFSSTLIPQEIDKQFAVKKINLFDADEVCYFDHIRRRTAQPSDCEPAPPFARRVRRSRQRLSIPPGYRSYSFRFSPTLRRIHSIRWIAGDWTPQRTPSYNSG
jgi:hypothetical protein